jgi:hypothetical protein
MLIIREGSYVINILRLKIASRADSLRCSPHDCVVYGVTTVVDLMIGHPSFAEMSILEVFKYPVTLDQIMNLEFLYIAVPEWEPAWSNSFAVTGEAD